MTAYRELLEREQLIGRGFAYDEIVKPTRGYQRRAMPPDRLHRNIIPALRLAHDLRERMIKVGASGLAVVAVYRPEGGAARSAHKWNRAIDLQLLSRDIDANPDLPRLMLAQAAELWAQQLAAGADIGVGTYGPPGRLYTRRVHIDIGHSKSVRSRPLTWTISNGPREPAVIRYLESMDASDFSALTDP